MQWLKFAVSGSDVEFDRGYFSSAVTASLFSGSHAGNGSGLTGIVSASYAVSASWAPAGGTPTLDDVLLAGNSTLTDIILGASVSIPNAAIQVQNDEFFFNLNSGSTPPTGFLGLKDASKGGTLLNFSSSAYRIFTFPDVSGIVKLDDGLYSGSFQGNGSGLTGLVSASYALSASWAPGGSSVTASYALTASYATTSSYYQESKTFGLTIDGGGSAITTGVKGDITIPFNCTIDSWYITADQVGSIVIDVWKDVFANFPPTVADRIAGTEKPTLSSAAFNSDTSLTTWTGSIQSGDVIRFNVDSATSVTRVNLVLKGII